MAVRAHPGLTPDELREWRQQQSGARGRHGQHFGWSQTRAAEWFGVTPRSWQRYESGERKIPLMLVKRMQSYDASMDKTLDQIFETSEAQLDKWGSPFPALAHEFNEGGDDQPEEEEHDEA